MSEDTGPGAGGRLFLVGTPIGNLEDMTYRAVRVLREVDLIAAEDTRTARILLSHYEIHTPTVSFYEANERQRVREIVARLHAGAAVALISEAGMPAISDPGYPLIRACIGQGLPIDVIPGPSAVLTALLLSGFSPAAFAFGGFLPRRAGPRQRALRRLCEAREPMVLFESPRRLGQTLSDLVLLAPERPVAVIREMTKRFQEVRRGLPAELLEGLETDPVRGEVTLVIGDAPAMEPGNLTAEVEHRLRQGQTARDIADALARLGYSKREAYQLALAQTRRAAGMPSVS